MCGHNFYDCPPADQTACPGSGCWRRSHARWRDPVVTKPVEVATVPDTHMNMVLEEADKHLVMKEAVVPTAVQLGRAFQESCLRDVFSRF